MQRVLVIDKNKQSLMPCHPARARELLNKGKAAVYRTFPFTIILKEREGGDTQPIAFKIAPGSKATGMALVADFKRGNRVSNLTLACHDCNQEKGTRTAAEFGFPEIQKLAKVPLKDAAAVNATRWALYARLQLSGLPVEVGTGGRTKFNRTTQGYAKTH